MVSKRALKSVGAAAIAALALGVLTACFSSPVTGQSEQTLNDILKTPLAEYETTGPEGGSCGIDYCNYNKRINLSTVSSATVSQECAKLIDWAASIGATSWYHDSDYIPFPLQGYETQARIACVMQQMSESPTQGDNQEVITGDYLGEATTSMYGFRGIYPGNDLKSPFDIQFNSNRVARTSKTDPISRRWFMTVQTAYGDEDPRFTSTTTPTWDESFAALSGESRQLDEILDAVGQYRVSHPDSDPYSASAIKAAIAKLPQTTTYSLPKFANGSVHYIFVTSASAYMNKDGGLCMSLKPFNSKLMGVTDPGTGYTHFYINGFAQFNEFGSWVPGKCPTR
ncbi:MAG: hypothetical protein RLZZ600_738 [Actinomycetota bacterium]|jgi:hypothetical protein